MSKRKNVALVSDVVGGDQSEIILPRALQRAASSCAAPQDAEWRHAMLRRLQRQSGGGGQGILYCHPSLQPDVSRWLQQHPHLGWCLMQDDTLLEARVKLVTTQGETLMQWQSTAFS